MKIAICDDEQIFVESLTKSVKERFEKHKCEYEIFSCNCGDKLIEMCKRHNLDVIFLDIAMPGFDGFKTAEEIQKIRENIVLVFISSNEAMVFSSYEYKPFWFIPKTQMELLDIVIDKIVYKHISDDKKEIVVPIIMGNEVVEINLNLITYFSTDDHYIKFANKHGKVSNIYRCKLDDIEKQLNKYMFIRIHNRYLVNCRMVSLIKNSTCILLNDEKLPVSRSKIAETKEIFQDYLRSIR